MVDQAGTDPRPDLWVGIIAVLPWILLYLRGVIAELGKFSAQALWRLISRSLRTQDGKETVTVVVVLATGTASHSVDAGRPKFQEHDLLG
jgi:fumarate reductase subunit D